MSVYVHWRLTEWMATEVFPADGRPSKTRYELEYQKGSKTMRVRTGDNGIVETVSFDDGTDQVTFGHEDYRLRNALAAALRRVASRWPKEVIVEGGPHDDDA